jgi:topoisomerase-4 subunit A
VDLDQLEEAMIQKEPVTILCSAKGWIKAMKGHEVDPETIKYKDGDKGKFIIKAMTTDKILVLGTNGRSYTLAADKLPPGRGFGEPLRLMVDLPNDSDIVDMAIYEPEMRMILAADDGRGFIIKMEDMLAQTKGGKQVLNVSGKAEAKLCKPISDDADHVAVIGQNRKMIVFDLAQIPEMSKGKGVILQRYKDGGLSDIKAFNWDRGLTYKYGSGETMVDDLNPWIGDRAQAGRLPPNGFPANNKFD